MLAIIGTVLLAVVIILSVAIILGAPLGEFTLGGRYKVYPRKLKAILVTQLLLQLLFVIILLQLGGFIPLLFSHKITKIIGIVLAAYLSINCFANLFSKSKKERYVMTPLSLVTAICFWMCALQF